MMTQLSNIYCPFLLKDSASEWRQNRELPVIRSMTNKQYEQLSHRVIVIVSFGTSRTF